MLSDFAKGIGLGLRGAGLLLGTPRLWPLVLAPFVLSLLAFCGIVAGAIALRDRWMALLPVTGEWLRGALALVAELALAATAYFLYLPLAALIAAPFNESIAETVEKLKTGREPPAFSLGRFARDFVRSIVHEVRSLLRYLFLATVLVIASFVVPVVGAAVALVGGMYLAARFAAYDALDATLSRWGFDFERKLELLRGRRALCLGLGAVVAGLLALPIAGALAMPAGAAGGALLALEIVPPDARGEHHG
jgi:CysZ protein